MKALSAPIVPRWLRLLAAHLILLPARIFKTRLDPYIANGFAYNFLDGPHASGLSKWARWIGWSLWRPFDWALYARRYAQLTKNMIARPRLTPTKAGYPPPTYRYMCQLLSWIETAEPLPDDTVF